MRLPRSLGLTRSRWGNIAIKSLNWWKCVLEDMRNPSNLVVVGWDLCTVVSQDGAIAKRILHLHELHLRVLWKDISILARDEITKLTFQRQKKTVVRVTTYTSTCTSVNARGQTCFHRSVCTQLQCLSGCLRNLSLYYWGGSDEVVLLWMESRHLYCGHQTPWSEFICLFHILQRSIRSQLWCGLLSAQGAEWLPHILIL